MNGRLGRKKELRERGEEAWERESDRRRETKQASEEEAASHQHSVKTSRVWKERGNTLKRRVFIFLWCCEISFQWICSFCQRKKVVLFLLCFFEKYFIINSEIWVWCFCIEICVCSIGVPRSAFFGFSFSLFRF